MLRGKKSRVINVGRRLFGERAVGEDSAVATAERSALLGLARGAGGEEASTGSNRGEEAKYTERGRDEDTASTGDAVEEPFMGADPTQRLLTALGRFQRQVAKAESGTSQEAWCDECMNQLITGIEIALSQAWDNVREALTDTARILQSYEEARRAAECVTFLQDSYEILCLMVGDIIVDNTRSGVMKKWREHYNAALTELARAGLQVIDDEEEHPPAPAQARQRRVNRSFQEAASSPTELAAALDARALEAALSIDAAVEDEGQEFALPADEDTTACPADDIPAEIEEAPRAEQPRYEAPMMESLDNSEWLVSSGPVAAVFVPEESSAAASPEVFAHDVDDPADIPPEEDFAASVGHGVEAGLGELPEEDALTAAAGMEETPPVPVELPTGELPEETGDAGVVLPEELPETPVQAAPVCAAGPPAAEMAGQGEAPEIQALFRTVQSAVNRGDVAQAKLLALQLAASMARLEVDRAEHDLAKLNKRLEDNDTATAAAREAVIHSEETLHDIEGQISESQTEFQAKRQHIGELRERLTAIDGVIEDIDAQILMLQERRQTELGHHAAEEMRLEEALSEESRIQTDLEELSEAEQQAQQRVDQTRQRVEKLRQAHADCQADIERAKTHLEDRCGSVGEIERTLHSTGPSAPAEQSELSFE
ncbi:MAG: hypothetical protein HYV26_06460 [Candidatus Hydrogenedentes bacterium]|nr:hypothetical protein [Candidatus Hydrogenedentota bacterium]